MVATVARLNPDVVVNVVWRNIAMIVSHLLLYLTILYLPTTYLNIFSIILEGNGSYVYL